MTALPIRPVPPVRTKARAGSAERIGWSIAGDVWQAVVAVGGHTWRCGLDHCGQMWERGRRALVREGCGIEKAGWKEAEWVKMERLMLGNCTEGTGFGFSQHEHFAKASIPRFSTRVWEDYGTVCHTFVHVGDVCNV